MMRRVLVTFAGVLVLVLAGTVPACAETLSPWWRVGMEVSPSNLPPEHEGEIIVVASDLGEGPVSGADGHPVIITDRLPAGVTATSISGEAQHGTPSCSPATLQCTFTGILYPYEQIHITIDVKATLSAGTVTTLANEMSVEGGGAPRATSSVQDVRISGVPTPFGVQAQGYELAPYDSDGTPATQAGSHPSQLTSTLIMNQTGDANGREPVALPRNLRFQLPLGLVGDPQATAQCPASDFYAHTPVSEVDECPPGSVVGVATVTIDEPEHFDVVTLTAPVFNLVPSEGEPARFGFEALGLVPVVIQTAVDPGDDYAVIASVKNASELAGLLSSQVTLWGVPGDPSHNQSRGWECVEGGVHHERGEVSTPCPTTTDLPQTPFLTLPTSCAANPSSEPFASTAQVESWTEPGHIVESEYSWSGPLQEPLAPVGCEALPFTPSIGVAPETHTGSTPTGLDVSVKLPQNTTLEPNPEGLAEADVRDTTVTLPEGVQVNPSAANGLQACPEHGSEVSPGITAGGIGFTGFEDFQPGAPTATFSEGFDLTPPTEPKSGESYCPEASKLGTVRIKTPLLPRELEGALYLAEPAPNGEGEKNPFDSLIAMYIVAEDHEAGILVKLAGEGELNQSTGRVSTTFKSTPQLPFEELKVELFGGQRASLSTPASCGNYSTVASFTPWSVQLGAPATPAGSTGEEFPITEGCSTGTLPFSPSLPKAATNGQAGMFTPFTLQIARPDGDQALQSFSLGLPPGLAAVLASVPLCPEPAAAEGACGETSPESEIGQSLAESGVGSEPYGLPGKVYLTGPYGSAPFGLSSVTPLEHVGPFDLGRIVVRSGITINPNTAAASIDTAATTLISSTGVRESFAGLPEMIKGIPSQIKDLTVNVDRPGFTFNPTNCSPMAITATLDGWQDASSEASHPFQASNCASLPFSPTLTASVGGHASKANGTNLNVTVTSAGVGQANIQKVDLQFPKALSSRLTTLQKACTEAAFNANPASCDPDSVIGHATVHTPLLKSSLTGPAYLVSHGGAAFPDVEFVLQGEGVEIVLDGKTDIKEGITYSKFESAPDAPFTTFETELPSGPDSIFTANVPEKEDFNLCKASLEMPTRIVAQDGTVIEPTTKIVAQGCGEVRSSKVKKLSLAQRLKQALAQCRKRYKHSESKRVKCERQAHARYTSLALAACRKQDKHAKKQRVACESLARRRYGAHAASRAAGKTARRHG